MENIQKTWALCAMIVLGLVAATIYHLVLGLVFDIDYPGNTFLFDPAYRFSDFYFIFESVQTGSPLSGKWSLYPPFAYVPLFPLVGLTWPEAFAIVACTFLVATILFFWCCFDFLSGWRRLTASVLIPCCSFGVIFALDRGNIDLLVFVYIIAFFALFSRERFLWSSLPLAAAIAAKIYPGALGVLLLLRRKYAAAALTTALTIALTLAAAALYPGGIAGTLDLMSDRSAFLKTHFINNPAMHATSLSYLSLVKIFCRIAGLDFLGNSGSIITLYNIITAAIFIAIVAYVVLRERTLWKQIYLLIFLMLVLPPVSYDYKLIFLLVPTALFLRSPAAGRREDFFHVVLIGFLLIPKAYFPLTTETKISGLINAPLLTILALYIIWTGLRRSEASTPYEASSQQAATPAAIKP